MTKLLWPLSMALVLGVATPARALERFAVVVGNNAGHDFRRSLRYAESDAEKLAQALVELGGFNARQVRVLVGQDADQTRAALLAAESQATAARAQGEQTLLLFYYSGHASADTLELGKSSLAFAEVMQLLRGSRAHVRLAFVDSCESGRLMAQKGATRAAPFPLVEVDGDLRSTGYAAITSSSDTELSQESPEIRGSFFTHYLVSGLRGAADSSGDGKVTLTEAYSYAYGRTVARTSAHIAGGQHPMYEFKLSGRGDVVLTEQQQETARLSVVSAHEVRLIVLSADGERALAEAQLSANQPLQLNLAPGRYQAYAMVAEQTAKADVTLKANTTTTLTVEQAFKPVTMSRGADKGGLFPVRWELASEAGAAVRRFPLGAASVTYDGVLTTTWTHPDGLTAVTRLLAGGAPGVGTAQGYRELTLLVGGGLRVPISAMSVRGWLLAGPDLVFLEPLAEAPRYSVGLTSVLTLGLVGKISSDSAVALDGSVGARWLRLRTGAVRGVATFEAMLSWVQAWP